MSTVAHTRTGSGEPMLLVHGVGHQRSAWGRVADRLAEKYDVIAVDLPGFGASPKPAKPHTYSIASYGDQLIELTRELGIDRPHVVGNSLGGLIALDLAARDRVATATALSPAGFMSVPELAWVAANLLGIKLASHSPYPVIKAFADKVPLRKISMASLYVHPERLSAEQALDDTLNLRHSKGFWPVFFRGVNMPFTGTPAVPTTIGWGEKDRLLLPREGRRARAQLPQVHHEWLPGCGHVPMLDDPEHVVAIVEATVQRANGRSAADRADRVPGHLAADASADRGATVAV